MRCDEILGQANVRFKVDKPFEILIKKSNKTEYIKLDIQTTEAPRIDNIII